MSDSLSTRCSGSDTHPADPVWVTHIVIYFCIAVLGRRACNESLFKLPQVLAVTDVFDRIECVFDDYAGVGINIATLKSIWQSN